MKYFRNKERGDPEAISREDFIKGMKEEFTYYPGYYHYEHAFMLIGRGQKLFGSQHTYWVEW